MLPFSLGPVEKVHFPRKPFKKPLGLVNSILEVDGNIKWTRNPITQPTCEDRFFE
jgi:hypothetical protein